MARLRGGRAALAVLAMVFGTMALAGPAQAAPPVRAAPPPAPPAVRNRWLAGLLHRGRAGSGTRRWVVMEHGYRRQDRECH